MNPNASDSESIIVDGQEMIVPTQSAWGQIKLNSEFRGRQIGGAKIVMKWVEELLPSNKIKVGLVILPKFDSWYPYFLLKLQDHIQRVQLRTAVCNNCNWSGIAAHAHDVDIYIGAQQSNLLFKAGTSYPDIPCPNCKGKLPGPVQWIIK